MLSNVYKANNLIQLKIQLMNLLNFYFPFS